MSTDNPMLNPIPKKNIIWYLLSVLLTYSIITAPVLILFIILFILT